jgi:hypothetical protein
MATGVIVGCFVGIGILSGVTLPGVSWIVAVGLVKLTLLASVGLIGAGATLHRLAKRADDRSRIAAPRRTEEL